ncbi:MAG: Ig-like domain-containing protein [Dethiobacter sp.]|nr:Ig-like domain-containing protein [Dethiobacter sp.]
MLPAGVIASDTYPPTVTSSVPANAATGVAIGADIIVTFSEDVSEAVYFNQITITNGGTVVEYTYSLAGNTLTLNPIADLIHSTLYTVTLPAEAVQDAASNLSALHSFSFTTAAAPDVISPTVTSSVPANAATGVAIGADIIVTFSEDVFEAVYFNQITITNGGTVVEYTYSLAGLPAAWPWRTGMAVAQFSVSVLCLFEQESPQSFSADVGRRGNRRSFIFPGDDCFICFVMCKAYSLLR